MNSLPPREAGALNRSPCLDADVGLVADPGRERPPDCGRLPADNGREAEAKELGAIGVVIIGPLVCNAWLNPS